jgi:hypothetical protein
VSRSTAILNPLISADWTEAECFLLRYSAAIDEKFSRKEALMTGKRSTWTGLVLLGCIASLDAQATLITFDPDDFAAGTDVSTASPYVSLSTFRKRHDSIGDPPSLTSVFVDNCYDAGSHCASTGTKVFSDGFGPIDTWGAFGGSITSATGCFRDLGQGVSSPNCTERFNVMLMTFTEATDFVSISGRFWAEDETRLFGFDDSFNLIGLMDANIDRSLCRGPGAITDYCSVTTTLTSTSRDIRYVIAGGWSNGTSLDNLQFSVPEPGTLALLGVGLAGIMFARRRKLLSDRTGRHHCA